MEQRCHELKAKHSAIKDVRGRGMIQGLDFQDGDFSKKLTKACFDKGLVISPCGPTLNVMKLIPPLTIEPEVLDAGLEILDAALGDVGA